MKKLMTLLLGIGLSVSVWAGDNEDLATQLREMRQELDRQRAEIGQLQERLNQAPAMSEDEVSRLVSDKIEATLDTAGWAQEKQASSFTLGGNIKNLKLTGDLRLRYERREVEDSGVDEKTRDRLRTRLRLGLVWKANEADDWEIGVGLATGGADATSTNDTWSDASPFDTGDIRLDYAYAKHAWEMGEDTKLTLTLGQHKNPFLSSFLLWDGDVRPAGITGQYTTGPFFVTVGGYEVKNASTDQASSQLLGAQTGLDGSFGRGIEEGSEIGYKVAVAYYHFNNPTTDNDPALVGLDNDYTFHVGDLYGELSTDLAKDVALTLYGDLWKNFGADGSVSQVGGAVDPQDNDLGWVVGTELGVSKFKLSYEYGRVEADSVWYALKDSDFGDTAGLDHTNVEGHKIGLSYKATKNMSVGLTAMYLEEIEDSDKEGDLYQFDISYKF